jgi:putative DNA primase/helicase
MSAGAGDSDIEKLARKLWGEPNRQQSTRDDIRFGSQGSKSVRPKDRTWYDHETNEGGGYIDLYVKVHGERPDGDQIPLITYDYHAPDGSLAYQVVRKIPKAFVQRRPDGNGGWVWKMAGITRVPYRLPELMRAPSDVPVFVCEGEKDVDALRARGLVATTNPGGAGKWRSDMSPYLRGRDVIILPDNDHVGDDHALDVAAKLHGIARSVTIHRLPGLPDKGDVSDWIAAGGDAAALLDIAINPVPPPLRQPQVDIAWEDAPPPDDEGAYGVTRANGHAIIEVLPPEFADDALALNFSGAYGQTLRFVAAWGRWFKWDEQVWRHDDTLHVYDLCRRTCRSYAVNSPPNVQKAITSGKTIAAVEKLIRSDRRHAATVGQWDADPWLLNTPTGIVDLTTREILAHDPMHHMTKRTAVGPDATGGCPLWLKFLDEATAGDTKLQAYLQRVCGYALTGITREHAMFFAYGTGRNGKGVFLNTIVSILGDYAMTADPETFTASGSGKHLTVLARLQGARLVVAQETEEGAEWAEARVKSITGGDPITANFMRQDHFTYTPQFKLFMSGNHKPALKSVDEAIKARFNLVPFVVTIPKERRDVELIEKLATERPAILRWMIDGCWDWQQVRLSPPSIVTEATGEYFQQEDAVGLWMQECCDVRSTVEGKLADLFKSWTQWANSAGEDAGSKKRFTQTLASRGLRTGTGTGNVVFVQGIRLPVSKSYYETENDR